MLDDAVRRSVGGRGAVVGGRWGRGGWEEAIGHSCCCLLLAFFSSSHHVASSSWGTTKLQARRKKLDDSESHHRQVFKASQRSMHGM